MHADHGYSGLQSVYHTTYTIRLAIRATAELFVHSCMSRGQCILLMWSICYTTHCMLVCIKWSDLHLREGIGVVISSESRPLYATHCMAFRASFGIHTIEVCLAAAVVPPRTRANMSTCRLSVIVIVLVLSAKLLSNMICQRITFRQ